MIPNYPASLSSSKSQIKDLTPLVCTHWGGEEIVVLEGCFIDEYGEYPSGGWLRRPHMCKHFPRVEEETLILVKVGHLPVGD